MSTEAWIAAICLIVMVVVVNIGLLAALRNRSQQTQFDILSKAIRRARSPWEEEDKQLAELNQLVSKYKNEPTSSDESKDTQNG